MEEIFENYQKSGRLHHAYCIECSLDGRTARIASLQDFLKRNLDFTSRGNPDFWMEEFDTFGIDEARRLKEMQAKMPAAGGRKIFLLQVKLFTREAQNSLLKTFEEPTDGTHFFILIPSAEALLPTLRSRMIIVGRGQLHGQRREDRAVGAAGEISVFLLASMPERFELIKKIVDEKDRTVAISFLDRLEMAVYADSQKNNLDNHIATKQDFFRELFKMKSYLGDRSSSVKMILEHIALVLPDKSAKMKASS